jgi:hypothetical protein
LSTKQFTVVFIAADGAQVVKKGGAKTRTHAINDAIDGLGSSDLAVLGIDSEGRPFDVKHWPCDEHGFPVKAAQTEGLVLRTVTTVERVTAT